MEAYFNQLTNVREYAIILNVIILLEVFIIFLVEDIVKELSNNDNINAINELKVQIQGINSNKNILIIGSGGSYISALLTKLIIEKNMPNLCEVLKPMEILQSNLKLFSYAIIYSYKMKSYDINKTIKELLELKNIKKIIIVTSNNKNVNNDKIKYICYDPNNFEDTYISFKGIYYPTYLMLNCFDNLEVNANKINDIKIDYINNNIIDVFYDKENYHLAQLIERHFCELGIVTVRLHEKKDFSHGRMNILSNNDIIYLKSYEYEKEYEDLLLNYLINVKKCRLLNKEELDNDFNYFEKILIWLKWINQIVINKDIDIHNKKDTKEDERLFKYKEEKRINE